jgi:hypothetical protein
MLERNSSTHYTVIIKEGITTEEVQLVNDYWEATQREFISKPEVVAKQYGLTKLELRDKIKELSHCQVHLGYCSDCKQAITTQMHSQYKLQMELRYANTWCKACSDSYSARVTKKRFGHKALPKSVSPPVEEAMEPSLTGLTAVEFHLLRLIVEHQVHTFAEISQYLFEGELSNKASYWAALYSLGRKHIIQLTIEGKSLIKRIDFEKTLADRVAQVELEYLMAAEQDRIDLPSKQAAGQINPIITSSPLELDAAMPDYQGTFTIDKTIVLHEGDTLSYQTYKDKQGNLMLAIQINSGRFLPDSLPLESTTPSKQEFTLMDEYEDKPPF